MARGFHIAILSDIHYASTAEQALGADYETRRVGNPLLRLALRFHRRFIWLNQPLHQNHLLDDFIARAGTPDFVIANGDYSCDTANVGVSNDASFQSARECLDKLRARYAPNFQAAFGDHELGKLSFFGMRGGMRLAAWRRSTEELGLQPLWQAALGRYVLLGLASPLVALPAIENEALPDELPEWRRLREQHLADIRRAFAALQPDQRVVLFCHDPTALPFLWREEIVRNKISQIEQTVIGHLHSNLILWKSRLLAGIPPVRFLGHTVKKLTTALAEARHWRPFRVRLCPALAGIELLKDGGYLTAELDADAKQPARFQFHRLPR